jgi:hypothetical protein
MSLEKRVGDVNSSAKGSGARYNSGKTPLELIPIRFIAEQYRLTSNGKYEAETEALLHLARFQEGGNRIDLYNAITAIGADWKECAAVFDYGRIKYAEWNWAKGMVWSVPIACAARHIVYGMLKGEVVDPESKLAHRGHFLCNIVMLLAYTYNYLEGDDRTTMLKELSKDPLSVAGLNDSRTMLTFNELSN